MAVCTFFMKGNCRNGDNCRFEHPSGGGRGRGQGRGQGGQGGQGRGRGQNPFNSDSNRSRSRSRSRNRNGNRGRGDGRQYQSERQTDSYRPQPRNDYDRGRQPDHGFGSRGFDKEHNLRLDANTINVDLTAGKDLPEWPFSNYAGAGTIDVPAHMFHPAMEMSPEEIRCAFYLAKIQGREQEARDQELKTHRAAMAEMENVKNNIPAAIRKVVTAKREHPNRWDIVDKINNEWKKPDIPYNPDILPKYDGIAIAPAPEATPTAPAPTGFGAPSGSWQLSPAPSPPGWGGQPASPVPAVPAPPFQPAPGSLMGSNFPFGAQPPAPTAATNPFGTPSPVTTTLFGQRSAPVFGKPAFGQPPPVASPGGFGAPLHSTGGLFGTSQRPNAGGFGAPSGQPAQAAGGFGQSSGFGAPSGQSAQPTQTAQSASGFGQSSGFRSPSEQPAQPTGGFGQSSGFGTSSGGSIASTTHSSGFGKYSNQTNSSGFGTTLPPQNANPFGKKPAQNGNLPPLNTHQPGVAGPSSGTPKDADPPPKMYVANKEAYENAYQHVNQTGRFEGDLMPEPAPVHELVRYGNMERRVAGL